VVNFLPFSPVGQRSGNQLPVFASASCFEMGSGEGQQQSYSTAAKQSGGSR
jgi:hypothetical protein